MSQQSGILDKTFKASTDLSTATPYCFVKMSGSGTPNGVELATANTDVIIGVLQNDPKEGEAAVVRVAGTSKLTAGTPLAIGDNVSAEAAGRGMVTIGNTTVVAAVCLETAVNGDIVEVLLTHFTLAA